MTKISVFYVLEVLFSTSLHKKIEPPGSISNGRAQIWGECDYDAYMFIKTGLFKFGSGHITVYMNYMRYHSGLLDYLYRVLMLNEKIKNDHSFNSTYL